MAVNDSRDETEETAVKRHEQYAGRKLTFNKNIQEKKRHPR
jgi:hypothetical protein